MLLTNLADGASLSCICVLMIHLPLLLRNWLTNFIWRSQLTPVSTDVLIILTTRLYTGGNFDFCCGCNKCLELLLHHAKLSAGEVLACIKMCKSCMRQYVESLYLEEVEV
jgi:hypothetical protein